MGTERNLTRRDFLKGAAALAATGLVAGCAPPAAPAPAKEANAPAPAASGSKGKLKIVYAWPFPAAIEIQKGLCQKFSEQSKTIEVEFQVMPYEEMLPKYNTAFTTGAGADILTTHIGIFPQFAAAGWLEPLDERLKASGWGDNVVPVALAQGRAYKNTLYQLGHTVDIFLPYYNKELVAAIGAKGPPNDINEYHDYARRITNPDKNTYGVYLAGGGVTTCEYMWTWMLSYGGKGEGNGFFDKDGKCIMNGPKHVEGMQRWFDMYLKEKVSPEAAVAAKGADAQNAFKAGLVGMYYDWLGGIGVFTKAMGADKFNTFIPPDGPAGRTAWSGVNGYAINKASPNKDAAWEFLSFMMTPESNTAMNKEWGAIPATLQGLKDPYLEAEAFQAPKQIAGMEQEQAMMPFHLPEFAKFFEQLGVEHTQKVLLGQESVQQYADWHANYWTEAQQKLLKG